MSQQSAPKTYAPVQVKSRDTQYGQQLRFSFKAADLIAFIEDNTNDKGYINLNIIPRKEVGKYGETHSVTLDTWQPDPNRQRTTQSGNRPASQPAKQSAPAPVDDDGTDSVPF